MKRLPIVVSLLAVVLLSASIAYWGMQFFRVEQRPIQAVAIAPEPVLILAMGLVVLLIVLAVLMPIIEINQLVQ